MIRIPQPRRESDPESTPLDEPALARAENNAEEPILAIPVATEEAIIRQGSPFAAGTIESLAKNQNGSVVNVSLADLGPLRYTADGALVACGVTSTFAIAATYWFPWGGFTIATLGLVLAVFGIQSQRTKLALALVALQLGLVFACLSRAGGL